MRLARYWLRSELRRRWRAWFALGLLIGLVSAGILVALAGARRTDSAYRRFVEVHDAFDVVGRVECEHVVPPPGSAQQGDPRGELGEPGGTPPSRGCFERLRSLPVVADLTTVSQYGAQFSPVHGRSVQPLGDTCYSGAGVVNLLGDESGRYGTEINHFRVIEGREARPERAE